MADLGLTPKEVGEVGRTWGIVDQNLKQHGINLLIILFKQHPEYRTNFKKFEGVPVEKLADNEAAKKQASDLMQAMASFVNSISDKGNLVGLLRDMLVKHQPRKVGSAQFAHVMILVLPYLKDTLGSELTTDGATGWKKVIDSLNSVLETEEKKL